PRGRARRRHEPAGRAAAGVAAAVDAPLENNRRAMAAWPRTSHPRAGTRHPHGAGGPERSPRVGRNAPKLPPGAGFWLWRCKYFVVTRLGPLRRSSRTPMVICGSFLVGVIITALFAPT